VWSFGCNLDDASRPKFNDFVSALLSPLLPENVRGHDLFDYFVDTKDISLQPWSKLMSPFVYDPKASVRWPLCVRACVCSGTLHSTRFVSVVPRPLAHVVVYLVLLVCRSRTSTSSCRPLTRRATRT
jgi:hypothetical protein